MLGIGRDADDKAIKDAFRTLAMKYHPDRNKDPGAEEKFKGIAEAYAVLSDPRKRRDYDLGGHAGVSGISAEDLFGGIDFQNLFGGLNLDFGAGLFDRFFGRGSAGPERGANVELDLQVSLERVRAGGEEEVRYQRKEQCRACRGNGAKGGTAMHSCPRCKGSGQLTRSNRKAKDTILIQQISTCPDCQGSGRIVDERCPDCQGGGRVTREDRLRVKVPRGIEDGMALRVPGHGLPPEGARGVPGDLYVIVRAGPDPRFVRAGADLWRTESIDVTEAVLGTTLNVPTLDDPVALKVPPGTQPETVLRVRGKGLPTFGGGAVGDLNVRVSVRIPERLTPDERALYERLRSLRPAAAFAQRP